MSSFTKMLEKKMVAIESVGYYRSPKYSSLISLNGKTMYGAVRVFVFFLGIFIIPCALLITPLYLRHKVFSDVAYAVTETDVVEITGGISSIFCEEQTIKMNTSFNAFQIEGHQVDSYHKKHFRLHKNMLLPDDSLEYWGFFLNKGSIVKLSLCSKLKGGRLMIVKDIKDFHSCGLLERKPKSGPEMRNNFGDNEVQLIFNTDAEVVEYSNEFEGENINQETSKELKKYAEMHIAEKIKQPQPKFKRSINEKSLNHVEGFLHGKTNDSSDSSMSSFETALITCHDGRILLNNNFTYSNYCNGFDYLENRTLMQIQQEVHMDGYYFYIFYSDNDEQKNQVFAIFDIFKPTYEFSNYIKGCINQTKCTFPITFLSNEKVVIEVPMKNGIEHETDDVEILISTCQPRTLVYSVFPITAFILILGFSFI